MSNSAALETKGGYYVWLVTVTVPFDKVSTHTLDPHPARTKV